MILKDLQKRASKGECLVINDFDGREIKIEHLPLKKLRRVTKRKIK